MKEVIEFEDIIRRALPRARREAPFPLVQDANNIMRGLPTSQPGSRKERLRGIAEQMKAYLTIERPADDHAKAMLEVDAWNAEVERTGVDPGDPNWLEPIGDDVIDDANEGCPNKGGHEFVEQDTEDGSEGRSYCQHCLADGDA